MGEAARSDTATDAPCDEPTEAISGRTGAASSLISMADPRQKQDATHAEAERTDLLLDVARDEAKEAVRVSEILDTKGRTLPQVASVFFAASQLAVTTILTQLTDLPTWILIATPVLGVFGLVAVAYCLIRSIQVQRTTSQGAVEIAKMREYLEKGDDGAAPSRLLLSVYSKIVENRRKNNKTKGDMLDQVQIAGIVAVSVTALQLLVGILASVLGSPAG